MPLAFPKIGLFAKHNTTSVLKTLEKLIHYLRNRGHFLFIEQQSASLLSKMNLPTRSRDKIGAEVDLVIVVGGDGSLLNAARALAAHQVPLLGINRGRLGFLADILPHHFEETLTPILENVYIKEQRFLLEATVYRQGKMMSRDIALNDIVLYGGNIARMIDFEVYIDECFVLRQQADGIITATPTGSTAYALSAGGPILYPTLNAMTITPMCPHTLSNRSIVVNGDSRIKLRVTQANTTPPKLSYDGQMHVDLAIEDEIFIRKHPFEITLIHPTNHDYFSVLREKLGWNADLLKE